ncbi:hypothetical protein HX065_17205 [Myroides odoratimimus]|uniref:hypothetical protein n=1 Tax=Myroides odoratimimus TaxID=76832 RepID=UPI0025775C7C|nr:hypothetical protein [Myroides odoratimimus]MDM1461752.1 hypothetical protein [Myroides odoratimimus]
MGKIMQRVNYNTYFPDGTDTIDELLAPFKKVDLQKIASLLITKSTNEIDAKNSIEKWFSNSSISGELIKSTPNNRSLLNPISGLSLLEYIISKEDIVIDNELDTNEFELRLFKAYLLFNSNQEKIEEDGLKNNPDDKDIDYLPVTVMMLAYHDYDITNYNLQYIFLTQLIKSIEFFNFLENDERFTEHLKVFLEKYSVSSWQDWIKNILPIILPVLDHNDETYSKIILEDDENLSFRTNFLKMFSIPLEYKEIPDFVGVRGNPLIQIDEKTFIVNSKLFLVERIFKSLTFEFSLNINEIVPDESKLNDFRGLFCDAFSEQTLLYKVVSNSFPKNNKYIKIKGEDFKEEGYSAEPDYYVRFKNKVLLFESKDVILTGKQKQSHNYEIVSKALKEKFLKIEKKGSITNKAILQIIENIDRVFNKFYNNIDTDYNEDSIRIYPILVVHDKQFDTPGLNKIINNWFEKEVKEKFTAQQIQRINKLTIINIDTFILFQEHFSKRGEIGLEVMIDKYNEYIDRKFNSIIRRDINNFMESFISFNKFCEDYFRKNKIILPNYIDEYISKLMIE